MMRSIRVLYAGNNSLLALALREMFKGMGCEFTSVTGDTTQALRAVKMLNPRLIFVSTDLGGPISAEEAALIIEGEMHAQVVLIVSSSKGAMLKNSLESMIFDSKEALENLCASAPKECENITEH